MFGYFPTYALGNMYGAQFVERADQDLGGLGAQFREGKFAPFLGWLREKIHLQGQRFTASELCVNVTRKKLGCEALVRQLNKKFGALYGF